MKDCLTVSELPLMSHQEWWYKVLLIDGDGVYFCEQCGTVLTPLACFTVFLHALQ
jgi:hypothetical protein